MLCFHSNVIFLFSSVKGVVEKFVEFFGPAVEQLSIADRATIRYLLAILFVFVKQYNSS